jgi:16S rRNA (uracil1498-N3)-methyltransferase
MYFYTTEIDNNTLWLEADESLHAAKVLRLKPGTSVQVIDGNGGFYQATLIEANPRRCQLHIDSFIKPYRPIPYELHIAIAPTKNIDRLEWFLEKATEIGISEITPILCDRSERKQIKNERLDRILLSAIKQSQKAFLPKLNELTPLKTLIAQTQATQRYIAHCDEGERKSLKQSLQAQGSILILIGPEGDFSQAEIKLATAHNFRAVTLGTERLRTETAGIVACHTTSIMLTDV